MNPNTPIEKIKEYLINNDVAFLSLCNEVLNDERFSIWSGSSKPDQHHYGKGGLARHTQEVLELCMLNANYFNGTYNQIYKARLMCAAIFHDCGKMDDYTAVDFTYEEWKPTEHKYKIHHISRSAIFWNEKAHKHKMPKEFIDDVTHAILSHHGLREWGSPVSPRTRIAWILHLSDQMSARMYDCYSLQRK